MANLSFLNQRNLFGSDISLSHLLETDDLCYVIKEEIGPRLKDSDFEDRKLMAKPANRANIKFYFLNHNELRHHR